MLISQSVIEVVLLLSVQYVSYGPFSSFAPQYDSSFASISKEESDLLLATYGDETGVQYAKRSVSVAFAVALYACMYCS